MLPRAALSTPCWIIFSKSWIFSRAISTAKAGQAVCAPYTAIGTIPLTSWAAPVIPASCSGSGVSVMATLHFYQNCKEMAAILKKIGLHKEKAAGYSRYRRQIEAGLFQYAIDRNAAQERRVVHGWGDKLSYKIGSWRDPDNRARISSTSHAFWVLSGMIHTDVTMRESILKAFEQLDSKYGLRTFDVPFPPSMRPLVGRICTTTPEPMKTARRMSTPACLPSWRYSHWAKGGWHGNRWRNQW